MIHNSSRLKQSIILKLFIIYLCIVPSQISGWVKPLGCFALSACTSWRRKKIALHPTIQKIAKKTNTNEHDISDIITLSSFTWGVSYLSASHIKHFLRLTVLTGPLIMAITTSKTFNKYISFFLSCSNEQCEGICDNCKISQIYKALPFKIIANYFYDNFSRILFIATEPKTSEPIPSPNSNNFDPNTLDTDSHEIYNGLSREAKNIFDEATAAAGCSICQDDECNRNIIPVCPNGHGFCLECIAQWAERNTTCPSCRDQLLHHPQLY